MIFGDILSLIQGWSNQVWNYELLSTSQNWVLKVDLGTHLKDKRGNLFLWDLDLFCLSFKVGQTKVENMHFCQLSWNSVLKVDLGTHFKDKHGTLFLWHLELFLPTFKVGQTKVENMHFCRFSCTWNFKVDLDTHLEICTFVDFLRIEILK